MSVNFINPLSDSRYESFVLSHSEGTLFHSPFWIRILHETYGFRPQCIAVTDGDDFKGVLPYMGTRGLSGRRRFISLPFSDFCEPLFSTVNEFEAVLGDLISYADNNKAAYVDVRGGQQYLAEQCFYNEILTHDLDLSLDENHLIQSMRDSTRRNIRKAQQSGVKVTIETSLNATRKFYQLHCQTRKEHGVPPQPWFFFELLWRYGLKCGTGFITLATFKEKPVAADFFLLFKKTAFYKFGAMDRKYNSLRPSNLVMWEGIKKCKEYGCTRINFGRTELRHKGLVQFKRGFGCTERSIKYYRYDCLKRKYMQDNSSRFSEIRSMFLSRTPVGFLRLFSECFYRFAS